MGNGPGRWAMLSAIEERLPEPTARGLAVAVARAVSDQAFAVGDRLPPIRTVAQQLGLSPTTVSAAWSLLARAGTIHTDGRRGTVVAERRTGPERYRRTLRLDAPFALDLSAGTPDPELLPDLGPALRRLRTMTPTTYLDDPVLPELADVLIADWPFVPERMTILDGAMDAMHAVVDTHVQYGDRVAVEDPTFPPILDLLDAVGASVVPLPVDEDGPTVSGTVAAISSGVRALVLQPRAQNPTGSSLVPARVSALAAAIRDAPNDLIVVEDDAAGPVALTPAISLGTELPESTVQIRSFSKSHGPDLRLAAVGGAASIVDAIVERRFLGQGWTSRLLQAVLLELLTTPAATAVVVRARQAYAERRAALVSCLADCGVPVGGRDGINIWVPVRDESAALLRLATQGIGAAPGAPFHPVPSEHPHVRITAGLVRDEHRRIATELAAAADAGPRPRGY